jgi:hypothetical protein
VTTQDRHLVAEHDDLKLFGVCRSEQKGDKLQDPLQGNRNDGQEHGFSLRKVRHFTQIQLTHPTGSVRADTKFRGAVLADRPRSREGQSMECGSVSVRIGRPRMTSTNSSRNVTVGTTNRSAAISWLA